MSHKTATSHRPRTATARQSLRTPVASNGRQGAAGALSSASVSATPRKPAATPDVAARTDERGVRTSTAQRPASRHAVRQRSFPPQWRIAGIVGGALIVLLIIFILVNHSVGGATGQAGAYPYAVGQPGMGQVAPTFTLPSTTGNTFDLSAQHGKTVLLYFQEGLTCQPCWDQLKDINTHLSQFQALGINEVVSITTDPLADLQQKVTDEGITLPVLSDPNLRVSGAYSANQYGMMGTSRDGHSFIVVGPDGRIRWRADYGGAPNYTMYVPILNLLADLQKGLAVHGTGA